MRTTTRILFFVSVLLITTRDYVEAREPTRVDSRIVEVTVYSDRARVMREATIQAPKGVTILAFEKLPGWIDESSIRAALSPANGGSILDVRARREYLARASDEKIVAAEEDVREIEDQIAELDDQLSVLEARSKQVENVRAFSLEKLPRDTAVRQVKVDEYRAVVDFVADEIRTIKSERRRIARERRELEPDLLAMRRTLAELKQLTQLEQTTVLLTIETGKPRDATLTLTYMLPGATWESAHELRAKGEAPGALALTSYAILRQTTGEDWSGATISFSTQSAGESIQIPEVDALLLGGRQVVAQTRAGKMSSFQKATQVFEGQNGAWFQFNNPNANIRDFIGNSKAQEAAQARNIVTFQELRERGTTAHFVGEGMPTVRSDGNLVRVPIGRAELPASHKIVAAPEVSLSAARIVTLKNTGDQPLLPGETALFHGGAFLGQTDIDFVSSGEVFDVLFAIADQVKLSKTMDRSKSRLDRGRKSTRMQVAFDIVVENLSNRPISVELSDRIPVSDNDAIEVFRVDIEPEVQPDKRGLLKWTVPLKPNGKQTCRVEYTIEYPREILLRQSRQQPMQQSLGPMAADQMEDISIQIMDLEGKF